MPRGGSVLGNIVGKKFLQCKSQVDRQQSMSSWTPSAYVVGTSNPATGFPAYQWKSVNGALTVTFDLTASQIAAHTLGIGITTAFSGARPQVTMNRWNFAVPASSFSRTVVRSRSAAIVE